MFCIEYTFNLFRYTRALSTHWQASDAKVASMANQSRQPGFAESDSGSLAHMLILEANIETSYEHPSPLSDSSDLLIFLPLGNVYMLYTGYIKHNI